MMATNPIVNVPGHFHAPGVFFRAITKPHDVNLVYENYKIGEHPQTHSTLPGDFSYNGALYVMGVSSHLLSLPVIPQPYFKIILKNKKDAIHWGNNHKQHIWYMVQL
jgi:hypothetical protein